MVFTINAAIRAASGEVGYRERGTNDTRYNRWLGTIGRTYSYPWCASFQSWVADKAGGRAGVDYPRTAGCLAAVAWFKSHDRWSSVPHVGDWVLYGPGGGTHVELVIGVNARTITTIGGNTSGSLNGAYYNGDGVYRKQVTRASSRIYGYGRPNYGSEDDVSAAEVWSYGIDTGDGKAKWKAGTVLGHLEKSQDRIEAKLDAQALVIDKLVDQLGADRPDLDALKAEIRTAIESIDVRLKVADAEEVAP